MKHKNGKEPTRTLAARRTAQKLGVTRRHLRHSQEENDRLRRRFDSFRCRVVNVELECDVVAHMLRTMGGMNAHISARICRDLAQRIGRVGRRASYAFDAS